MIRTPDCAHTPRPARLRPLQLLLAQTLCCLPLCAAMAAEPAEPAGTPTAPQAAPSESETLFQALPQVAEIQRDGAQVVWKTDGAAATILSIDPQTHDPMIATPDGPLRVENKLIAERHTEALLQLAALIKQMHAGKIKPADVRLHLSILTGPNLMGDQVLIVPEGVMTKETLAAPQRAKEIERVSQDVAKAIAELPNTGMGDIAQRALKDVLQKLEHPDGDEQVDEVKPSFARRLVMRGWLRQWFPTPTGAALAKDLEQAVDAVDKPIAVSRRSGEKLRVEELNDAFGAGGWVYARPDKVRYLRYEPKPEYIGRIPDLVLGVDLPVGADPASEAGRATGAQVYDGTTLLASWTSAKGFVGDAGKWRQAVNARWSDMVPDAIPEHIVLCDLHGDIAALLTPGGVLKPVQNPTKQAAERFLDDAAKTLKQPNELDLIGEYLFTYAYPSPDAQHPELLGNKQLKSNVQQTVWQTCGNVSGGSMHGDCADIAELYENIVSRQGLNPIVIGLPEHAACAWAIKSNDDWKVTVLQTGPPVQFDDRQLPVCLAKAYKSFDPGMNFDANQLPLLLRFSGEQSRSEWALSWRIFSDPPYAKTMFDVQRDWHYQTYQRGIATMTKMIADGDNDNANFRELSGLSSFTGQYLKAAEYQRKAIEHTDDPISKLSMNLDNVSFLLSAGQSEQAKTLALDILDHQLPAVRDHLGPAISEFGLRFAAAAGNFDNGPGLLDLALRGLQDNGGKQTDQEIEQISAWMNGPSFNAEQWGGSTQMIALRMRLTEYCTIGMELIKALGHNALPGDERLQGLSKAIQQWIDNIAFRDIDEDSAIMEKYAAAGRWYGIVLGEAEFDHQLKASPMASEKIDHAKRKPGAEQMARDLPWIHASVFYWYQRLAEQFRRANPTIDPKFVAELVQQLDAARIATAKLGFTSPTSEYQAVLGDEVGALIAKDETTLRKVLHHVAVSNDKALRDSAAQWLGDAARFCDMGWYAKVMKIWVDEVDYKPKYFWIAWRAALNDAPEQALYAAKIAAERFKDDPSFTEEYQYMRSLLGAKVPTRNGSQPVPAGRR